MQRNNIATSLSCRKRAKQKHAKVVEIHPCANLFWLIALNSVLVGPVLASHPAMANSICRAYFSPTLLSSLVLPLLLGNMHRWETGRPDLFDVFLRKKSAFHMRAVFATRADRQSVALKYQRAHWEACHGGALRWCLTSFLTANTKTGCTHSSALSVYFNKTIAQILLIFNKQSAIFLTYCCAEIIWLHFHMKLHYQITQ